MSKPSTIVQAIKLNDLATAQELLNGGADINDFAGEKYSALEEALTHQSVELIEWALDNGADPYQRIFDGRRCAELVHMPAFKEFRSLFESRGIVLVQRKLENIQAGEVNKMAC
jgi:ankyrin repeat protein